MEIKTQCDLSLVGEEKCVARNNPARKNFEFVLAWVGLVRKKSKIFLAGAGLVSTKFTNSLP